MASDIGLVGLGTMGAALALNIAEKGFPIAVFNRTAGVTERFAAEAGPLAPRITPLRQPRGAGRGAEAAARDHPDGPGRRRRSTQMIAALAAAPRHARHDHRRGNANFHDTRRRAAEAEAAGLALSRRRRLRRRGGRAARPLDHGRRSARRPGTASRRSSRRSPRASRARPAPPGWAPTAPGTSSRPCTTASNTPTCR